MKERAELCARKSCDSPTCFFLSRQNLHPRSNSENNPPGLLRNRIGNNRGVILTNVMKDNGAPRLLSLSLSHFLQAQAKRQDYEKRRSEKKRTRVDNRKNALFVPRSREIGRNGEGENEERRRKKAAGSGRRGGRGQDEEKNAMEGEREELCVTESRTHVCEYVPVSCKIVNNDSHSRNSPFSFPVIIWR